MSKSAQRKLHATAGLHQPELAKLIRNLCSARRTHEVFSDFVELAALAISNSVDRVQFDSREARYLSIVGKYTPEEVSVFPKILGKLVLCYEEQVSGPSAGNGELPRCELDDVLGSLYMNFELGNEHTGQFFTPYEVSKMMAKMLIQDGEDVRSRGVLRLHEPACGAGGMVIAYADALLSAGINYQQCLHAVCVDIDPCCVHMAYLQLSLLNIPAVVVHGNALSMEEWGRWYTPAHVLGGWGRKLASASQREDAERSALALLTAPAEKASDDSVRLGGNPLTSTEEEAEPSAVAQQPIDFKKLEQLVLF